jgi:hypothetical protein
MEVLGWQQGWVGGSLKWHIRRCQREEALPKCFLLLSFQLGEQAVCFAEGREVGLLVACKPLGEPPYLGRVAIGQYLISPLPLGFLGSLFEPGVAQLLVSLCARVQVFNRPQALVIPPVADNLVFSIPPGHVSQFFRISASNVGHVTHHMIIHP